MPTYDDLETAIDELLARDPEAQRDHLRAAFQQDATPRLVIRIEAASDQSWPRSP